MPIFKQRIFHPWLLAVYPILALLAYNIEETHAGAALRAIVISLAAVTLWVLLAYAWLKNWQKAALLASLAAILFFSYGHVYNALEPVQLLGFAIGRHRLLFPLWLVLMGVGSWWILTTTADLSTISRALNLVAGVALIFPLIQIGLFGFHSIEAARAEKTERPSQLHLPTGQSPPDIYYIILDAYARDDILKKYYQWDNTPFLDQLKTLGFSVPACSQSNYAQTQLSLASSLNFNYLEALSDRFQGDNTSRAGLPELIQHSAVRQALESLGYTTVAFETGFDATQLEDAAHYLAGHQNPAPTDFENLLIRTTAGRVVAEGIAALNLPPDWEARDQAHREQVLFTLHTLAQVPDITGPKFVFAHIVSPHWPHVFGPNGEPVHEHPDSSTGYRNQVIFLDKQVIPLIQTILEKSAVPPIIIIQGDHGSVIEAPNERMPILNAYYLPQAGSQALWESISPVNSFRLVLNQYFGGSLPYLPDTSYYSNYQYPYRYQIIPNTRPGCPRS